MDGRLTGIMNLAFHPGTCENEAVAAFLAARRLAGARGVDAIVAAPVVKEVVRKRSHERTTKFAQPVPARSSPFQPVGSMTTCRPSCRPPGGWIWTWRYIPLVPSTTALSGP